MILGLQGQFIRPERTLTSVYGFDVAVKELFYNFIKDKSMEEIAVISDENVYQTAILKKWTSLAQKNQRDTLNENINFYSELSLTKLGIYPVCFLVLAPNQFLMANLPLSKMTRLATTPKYKKY